MTKRPCLRETAMVRLNVGGWRYDASRTTLERAGFFRSSQNFGVDYDEDGCLFLDRDGHLFKHLLAYMRTGKRPPEAVIDKYRSHLMEEAIFFLIPDLELNLRGQTCDFDLRPEDRALRAAERQGDDRLHDVFASDCSPRDPAELQVPLLFDRGPRPQLKGTADDFRARLASFCGKGLLEELQALRMPHVVIAGGAVVAALTDTQAGDVDIFLTCRASEGIMHLKAVLSALQRAHAEATAPRAPLLVTRSAAAVTIYREGTKLPPVQVVLGVSDGLRDVLKNFDVDCCCVAYMPHSDQVLATARGLRALRYGACIVDTLFDSPPYTRRLEKYGLRGWRVGLPGLDEFRISSSLRTHHVLVHGVLLAVCSTSLVAQQLRVATNGKEEVLKPMHVQQARVVQGPARLYVVQRVVPEVSSARLLHLGGDRAVLLHGVPPEPISDDEGEEEGCSSTHLQAAVKLLERGANEGGALRKRAAGEMRGGTGPLAFVYDFATANSSLESLSCVRDAARCRGLETEDFEEQYGLPRELRFEASIARKTASVDWWSALYRE